MVLLTISFNTVSALALESQSSWHVDSTEAYKKSMIRNVIFSKRATCPYDEFIL